MGGKKTQLIFAKPLFGSYTSILFAENRVSACHRIMYKKALFAIQLDIIPA